MDNGENYSIKVKPSNCLVNVVFFIGLFRDILSDKKWKSCSYLTNRKDYAKLHFLFIIQVQKNQECFIRDLLLPLTLSFV